MRPVECRSVPLAQIEQGDDAQQVHELNGQETAADTDELEFPGRGHGQHGGYQHDGGLNPIAASFDGYGKAALLVADDVAVGNDAGIKGLDQPSTQRSDGFGERNDDGLLHRARELRREQRGLYGQEDEKEAQHEVQ